MKFELDLGEEDSVSLQLRALPACGETLATHSFFSQPNVGSLLVANFDLKFTNFSRDSGEFGFAPMICGNNPSCSEDKLFQTAVLVSDMIKQKIPTHGILTDATEYVKKPDCVSPNTFKWKQHVSQKLAKRARLADH